MSKLVGRKGSQVVVKSQKTVIVLNNARKFKTLLLLRKSLINLIGTIKLDSHITIRDFKGNLKTLD